MLQQVLTLLEESHGIPLSQEMIGRQLGLPAETVAQLLYTLVQRGRLVEVDEGCTGCAVCPLKVVCAGAPAIAMRGYALPDHKSEAQAESA
ncbi:MAG: FeoC-like transcriptional regulator [Chloroflexota bacterium]|nr:FeoC-like transcriptional regulator [Chloroflexota bacterium]